VGGAERWGQARAHLQGKGGESGQCSLRG
jgi:hypothetical protein